MSIDQWNKKISIIKMPDLVLEREEKKANIANNGLDNPAAGEGNW